MNERSRIPFALVVIVIAGGLLLGGSAFLFKLPERPVSSAAKSSSLTAVSDRAIQKRTKFLLLGDAFSGYSVFRNKGFLSELALDGVNLQYKEVLDQKTRAKQLSQGEADLIVTTLDEFLRYQPQGKVVALIDHAVGVDAVVLNTLQYPSLKSLLDLSPLIKQEKAKGNKLSIVSAGDAPSEDLALVLDSEFESFHLADFDIHKVKDASQAWDVMKDANEQAAIAVLWEPYVAKARKEGYSIALSSKDIPNSIIDVVVASDRLIENRPEVISQLLQTYYRQVDASTQDDHQLQAQIAKDNGLSVSEATTIINGLDFFTAAETKSWMDDNRLTQRISAIAAILTLGNHLDAVPSDPSALYDSQFVEGAAKTTQAIINSIEADNPTLADKLAGKDSQMAIAPKISDAEIRAAQPVGNLTVPSRISFATSSAELTSEGKQTLDVIFKEIEEFNPQTVAVEIIGHTSQTGTATANQTLSKARATTVASYLKEIGIHLNIASEGVGFSDPLPDTEPADERNQRTEVRLVRIN